VPKIRFHDLRHTSATLLLAEGVHPKIVQERLGHADVSITLNRYSHVTPTMQREALDILDAALDRVAAS
jgi:integrase